MNKISTLLLISVLSLSVFAAKDEKAQHFIYSKKTPVTFDEQRLARLDTALQQLVDKGVIPHAVTFVAHHGRVVHNKAFGYRNVENKIPCRTDDIFRIASQTKAITAVSILTLMEEGKLLLDEPVKKYIPEFSNPQVLVSFDAKDSSFTTRPAKSDITIRQLLTHTSGISYGSGNSRKIYDKMGIPVSPLYTLDNETLGDVIKRLAKCPLEFDPGEKFS